RVGCLGVVVAARFSFGGLHRSTRRLRGEVAAAVFAITGRVATRGVAACSTATALAATARRDLPGLSLQSSGTTHHRRQGECPNQTEHSTTIHVSPPNSRT